MRIVPLGTSYTIWTGIGTIGAFIVGITVLAKPASPTRLSAAALILAGLVVMKAATPA